MKQHHSKDNINNSFFQGIYKEIWKKTIPPGLTEAEVDFLLDVSGIQPGNTVLDVMCGFGRHALELARRGAGVVAVDNLPDYIREIEDAAAKEALDIRCQISNVLQLELTETFDLIICMGNSFPFFDHEDALLLLSRFSSSLLQGSKLVINSYSIAEIAFRHCRPHDWSYVGDYKYLFDNQIYFDPARIESEQIFISPDGTTEVRKGIDYIFSLSELSRMLESSGFRLKEFYGTPRKRKFRLGDGHVYIVAEKK